MNSNIKTETFDFNVFSVENLDDNTLVNNIKSEPRVSVSFFFIYFHLSTPSTMSVMFLGS
jgi:hypothetical protein